ncbi:NAD-dependent epimerase/dehydratase family protein [Paenibacillus sp. GCM10023248]|uniref:NAD-dependent epimerase/dehydratase family protein n=1 Tax=unclassified Paenibacillus TaxID=185978 RepID=UPI002378D4E1|nr:NAD-dependent epimerase/dehydratase family protein [Paenibacillus sp. MAHUQ-63]MDD9266614.1 NAD-dependent epimerase/dehydratase family protein [Paenibacillus sp. MAHUQ-63]
MKNSRCLLFGGGGFIGANLIPSLIKEGHQITVYDRNLHKKHQIHGVNYIEGNFFEENNFIELLNGQDVVLHLISGSLPATSMNNIYSSYENDVLKTLQMVESSRSAGVKKIVFFSSGGTVYGNTSNSPVSEESQNYPINHYGISKLTIEKMLIMYNHLYGMDNIILRISNPYGLGQNIAKKVGAVSTFIDKILSRDEIIIFGKGDIIRDYIHVDDISAAVVMALQYQTKNGIEPIFNIGTGIGTGLLELVRKLEYNIGLEANISFQEKRNIDVSYNVLDISKAQREFGFHPKFSLDLGIKDIIESIKSCKGVGQ